MKLQSILANLNKPKNSFWLTPIFTPPQENKCIYADENDVKNDRWRHIQLQLNLADGEPRFFIEAQYDPKPQAVPFDPRLGPQQQQSFQTPGYVALSKFSFKFGQCSRNDVNYCFAEIDGQEQDQQQPPPEQRPDERPVAPPPEEVKK